jgi:hypothetical protein
MTVVFPMALTDRDPYRGSDSSGWEHARLRKDLDLVVQKGWVRFGLWDL